MSGPLISVCIPARNEEKLIGNCLGSIRAAEKALGAPVEIIVTLNRCTDRTEEIALSFGAKIAREDAKNLAKIRNAAARLATGRILVTIDADCVMSEKMLIEVARFLCDEKIVGGGVKIRPDRRNFAIVLTFTLIEALIAPLNLSGGLFWCRRADFEAIGGFDEKLTVAEDLDFAMRLKKLGERTGRKFRKITTAHIVASCRKGELLDDWYYLNPVNIWKLAKSDPAEADRHWYEIKR